MSSDSRGRFSWHEHEDGGYALFESEQPQGIYPTLEDIDGEIAARVADPALKTFVDFMLREGWSADELHAVTDRAVAWIEAHPQASYFEPDYS